MANAVAKRDAAPPDPLRQAIDKMAPEFKMALPAHVTPEKFVRVTMTAINSSPDLREADRNTLFASVTKLAQDGLLPDGREAALVIFNSKDRASGGWIKKVQAMPMVSGLLKMMRQSGEVAWVDAQVVRANDHFQYRPGLDEMPVFEPDWFGDRGAVIGAYAVARLKSGEIVPPEIMSLKQIEEVRNVSRAKDRGPWVDWFDQMALKTVLRRYLKRLPTSTDLVDFMDRDETMATTIDHPATLSVVRDEPAEPQSRLDALEHHLADEGEPEPETEEPEAAEEGKPDEETGEANNGDPVPEILAKIEAATNHKTWKAAEDAYLRIAGTLPDEACAEIENALDDRKAALTAK